MSFIKQVKKRNGEIENFDPDKLNHWAEWASGLDVDWSEIAIQANKKCQDGCSTKDLQKALVDACLDKETTPHLYMAGRLLIGDIYKEAYNGKIPSLKEQFHKMVFMGYYTDMDYTNEELDYLDGFIDHNRDLECSYTELRQIRDKYSVLDRVNGVVYESPQFVYMRMALGDMEKMPKADRLQHIVKLYNYLSFKKINAPTPMMVNLGTPLKGYASCCVITTHDTAESLATSNHIEYMMTCNSAGIGSHVKTRSKGDSVRGGVIKHSGKLPYYRATQAMVGANLQNGRGGASTMHFNVLDPEIDDLITLRNPTSVEQKKIKNIDYSVGYNYFFVERVAKNQDWMLVSYQASPELYEAMYSPDQTKFVELFEKVYNDPTIPKTLVSARDLAIKFLTESVETGRLYLHRTDELNRHTPFKDTIYSSNLCQEIALPTKGFKNVQALYTEESAHESEIGLCTLASIVVGRIKDDEEYEDVAYYTLLMIDNVLEIMEYPFPNLKATAKARRSVGVGITNLAYDMASQGLTYSSESGKRYMHELAEKHSFFLHKASLRLAKERGVCDWMYKTKYPSGWLPIDTYCKEVDTIVDGGFGLKYDWESLRSEIVENGGIRHSVLEAFMPVESSSQATNSTNSIYPIRSLKVIKTDGNKKTLFIAPKAEELALSYEIAWEIPTKDLIDMYAIFQKFCGQAISADFYLKFDDADGVRKVSTKRLLVDFIYMTKMGMKTRYYLNSSAGVDINRQISELVSVGCASGACTL